MATRVDIEIASINLSASFALAGLAAGFAIIAIGFALLQFSIPFWGVAGIYIILGALAALISLCGFLKESGKMRRLKPDTK